MTKICEGRFPNQNIRQRVNGKLKDIIIPCNDMYTIYEQSGQLYRSINGSRPIPIY